MQQLIEGQVDTSDESYGFILDPSDELYLSRQACEPEERRIGSSWLDNSLAWANASDRSRDTRPILPPNTTTTAGFILGTSWLANASRKLSELSRYPNDWDSYGSPAISITALTNAIHFLSSFVFHTPAPVIVPVPGGGIQFEWQAGRRELELEIDPNGRIEYLKVLEDETTEEGEMASIDDPTIQDLLEWLLSPQDSCDAF